MRLSRRPWGKSSRAPLQGLSHRGGARLGPNAGQSGDPSGTPHFHTPTWSRRRYASRPFELLPSLRRLQAQRGSGACGIGCRPQRGAGPEGPPRPAARGRPTACTRPTCKERQTRPPAPPLPFSRELALRSPPLPAPFSCPPCETTQPLPLSAPQSESEAHDCSFCPPRPRGTPLTAIWSFCSFGRGVPRGHLSQCPPGTPLGGGVPRGTPLTAICSFCSYG